MFKNAQNPFKNVDHIFTPSCLSSMTKRRLYRVLSCKILSLTTITRKVIMENTWICDSCGGIIENVEDGWVEWLEKDSILSGLRLVHHITAREEKTRCQYPNDRTLVGTLFDSSLEIFLGANGLMQLLSLLNDTFKNNKDGKFENSREVIQMIKRLHIPGYEHARKHFKAAISEDVFEPNMPPHYYWQDDINAVLKWLKSR